MNYNAIARRRVRRQLLTAMILAVLGVAVALPIGPGEVGNGVGVHAASGAKQVDAVNVADVATDAGEPGVEGSATRTLELGEVQTVSSVWRCLEVRRWTWRGPVYGIMYGCALSLGWGIGKQMYRWWLGPWIDSCYPHCEFRL